jgi:hypothetical protein
METVEVQFLVESEFYYKNNVYFDTKVVKVQIDSNKAATAQPRLHHQSPATTASPKPSLMKPSSKTLATTIPSVLQKQVMPHETYCTALDPHCKLNEISSASPSLDSACLNPPLL